MELVVLAVPDCPNAAILEKRLAEALEGRQPISVSRKVVDSEEQAARWGMHGSPTLLLDQVDPFAGPGVQASLACRIYRGEDGQAVGVPSVAALRQALEQVMGKARDNQRASAVEAWPDSLGRAGRGRVAPVDGGLRAVHRRVLTSFATTGREPGAAELAEAAAPYGVDFERVLAELHAGDFLRLDAAGRIRAGYPFSAQPTPHVVRISGGPEVYAMCAIDALGIAAMLGTEITVASADPGIGEEITVTVAADGRTALWHPTSAVVFAGQGTDCESGLIAADVCCGYVNFFSSRASATAWAEAHPGVAGKTLEQTDALRLGRQIFGPLLNPADESVPHQDASN